MRLRNLALPLAAFLTALALIGPPIRAVGAAELPREAASVAEVEHVLRVGDELVRERRWGEALAHYEEALRTHPEWQDLESRLIGVRLHYEVAHRYADRSFLDSLQQLTELDALDVYSEVLLTIESHYVETPIWSQLVGRGLTAFETALAEPVFCQRYGLRISPEQIREQIEQVRQAVSRRPLRSRHDARDCAAIAARLAQRDLGLPPQAVVLEFVCSTATSLDEYSAFLTGSQMEEILSQIEGNFVGLGVELKAEDNSLLIVNVIPNGPADAGGLRPGDRIVRVDGQSTAVISSEAAADMLKGTDGSIVDLWLLSPSGESRQVRMQRRRVDVPSVQEASILDPNTGVAYIKLASFQKTTVRDMDAALWKLHRQGMRSLIIDLRGNPGGLLTAAVDVVDRFVSQGHIVSTRGRSAGEDYDYRAHGVGTWRVPLVVLIDGNSASASEIFASAIRDHRRGTLVGARSYGKGSVQGIFPLNTSQAGLRLTTARFYSPNGQPISRRGVHPDVLVHMAAKPDATGSFVSLSAGDPVLDAGVGIARDAAR